MPKYRNALTNDLDDRGVVLIADEGGWRPPGARPGRQLLPDDLPDPATLRHSYSLLDDLNGVPSRTLSEYNRHVPIGPMSPGDEKTPPSIPVMPDPSSLRVYAPRGTPPHKIEEGDDSGVNHELIEDAYNHVHRAAG